MSDGMVRFGENNWIRASQIESVCPQDVDTTGHGGMTHYQVVVRMIGSRKWAYTVASAETYRYSPEATAAKEKAEAKRDTYLSNLLERMKVAQG